MKSNLSSQQKSKVQSVQQVLSCSEKIAIECLRQENWNIENAIDLYFTNPPKFQSLEPILKSNIEKIFEKYQFTEDKSLDCIAGNGIKQFCSDLGIKLEDPVIIVISYLLEAETMGKYSRNEFVEGMLKNQWDSIETLQKQLPDLKQQLYNIEELKKIYIYAFNFAKQEKRMKGIPFEVAQCILHLLSLINKELWEILLKPVFPEFWKKWNDYLNVSI